MNWKRTTVAALALMILTGFCYQLMAPTSLDFTEDEAPFCKIKMPPKSVRANTFMDHGSVIVEIVDQTDHHYSVYFPIDYGGIRNAFPTAYDDYLNTPNKPPLKNTARAKSICIQLIKDHAAPCTDPVADEDLNRALRSLSNSPGVVAERIFDKIRNLFP